MRAAGVVCLEVRQLMLLAVLIGKAVDLLGQAAEGGAGEVQKVVDGALDGEALLRAVDKGGLGGARVLARRDTIDDAIGCRL